MTGWLKFNLKYNSQIDFHTKYLIILYLFELYVIHTFNIGINMGHSIKFHEFSIELNLIKVNIYQDKMRIY